MPDFEEPLIEEAVRYLKEEYGEDTVSMDVTDSDVENGTGVLSVDCTVSVDGMTSDWSKEFFFKGGKVTRMSYRMR